jgi:cystathionine gamma-synthase
MSDSGNVRDVRDNDTRVDSGVHVVPELVLEGGRVLRDVRIAFSAFGSERLPSILVLGGISAGRHLLDDPAAATRSWWPGVVGAGRPLDPKRHRLIGIDYVGGRGDSGFTELPPADAAPTHMSTADHARLILGVMDALGIERLAAGVGASFGGMILLSLCAAAPERVGRAIVIAAAHCSDPMATAARSLQRRIVELGHAAGSDAAGLAIARGLAITTYRSGREFRERFHNNAVESYLEHHGRTFAASFPGDGFVALSHALNDHRVDPIAIRTPLTLVGFDSDTLVPPAQVTALARAVNGARLTILPSRYGHDGFLKEGAALAPVLRRALADARPQLPSPTAAVRAGIASDTQYGAVMPPLHLSTTFTFEEFGRARTYDYTRSGNPTRDLLGCAIAELEGAGEGIIAATGMAAVSLPLQLLDPADLLLAPRDCYGGTHRLFCALQKRGACRVMFADFQDVSLTAVIERERPRMVWVESPSNPLLRITDITGVCTAAHAVGALVVVDNTFLSPALQRPLLLGADIVVHSTTKYINGHSDVVGGAVIARDAAIHQELSWWANCLGLTGSPFDAWLTLRGLRTVHVRMAAQQESAGTIAQALYHSPHVAAVYYPGLDSHPGHAIAAAQQAGFGAMLSFELEGGAAAARAFCEGLSSFCLAESLGGVESLVAHPSTMTHASMTADARQAAGISDGLLRLSIGLEGVEDLLDDVFAGVERAAATCTRTTSPLYR